MKITRQQVTKQEIIGGSELPFGLSPTIALGINY